jgi:hypothetical protein
VFLLELVGQTPQEYNIQEPVIDLPSEEEILKFMEEEN